jgi:hypothetical protein
MVPGDATISVRTMGLWDKLKNARNYASKRRGPDSYFQYKRKREDERKDAEQERQRESDDAEREQGEADRGREYEERYTAERDSDIGAKRTERVEEIEPDP